MIALTAITALAVIWYTYFTQQTLEHARRSAKAVADRQRSSLCTAVLWEMRSLLRRLHRLTSPGPIGETADFFSHPMLTIAAANPALMTCRDTIGKLAEVLRLLSDLQEFLRRYIELDTSLQSSTISFEGVKNARDQKPRLEELVRYRAVWAYNAAVQLVSLLTTEGGALPPPRREDSVTSLDEIPLEPDPFE
ncbi:MAG: hypothetical protein ABIR71_01080 [Chthoniobacterales bacterium]